MPVGGKGLAGVRWTDRETPSIPRDGQGLSTKLWFITQQAREDKIVQLAIMKIMEAIFEPDFCGASYGFRPNRSCHDARDIVDKILMTKPVNYVVDMDIAKFFDTVDHKCLMKCLKQRIIDSSFLLIIRAFGKASRKSLAKFGLTISEEKSRIIEFARYAGQQANKQGKKCATFDVLGFTHY